MAKGVRSARGEVIDFDLLRIKEQIGSNPKGSTVKAREDFIDKKLKRKAKRLAAQAAEQAKQEPEQVTDEQPEEEKQTTRKKIAKPQSE